MGRNLVFSKLPSYNHGGNCFGLYIKEITGEGLKLASIYQRNKHGKFFFPLYIRKGPACAPICKQADVARPAFFLLI
jgi:hypothetical protein